MTLKKRRTPIDVLFGERENIRIYPVKNNFMNTDLIPVSGIKIDQMVMIENHSYQYKGQKTIKKTGVRKTVYFFKGVSTSIDKEFNVTKNPTFKLINDILKMN